MPVPSPPDLQPMLAHASWLRALARNLVVDPNDADDLVQDTWRVALEGVPRPATSPRKWLGGVVRNLRREGMRSHARRAAREAGVARLEGTPPTAEIVEKLDLQHLLLSAIRAFDEPYRTTLFERFYEDLPPRAIARRHGIPVKTVKTRLARGLERLRVDLDRRHGGRREAWLSVLLPLSGWPGLPAPTVGMVLVNAKVKLAVVALALVGTGAILWNLARAPHPLLAGTAGSEARIEPLTEPDTVLASSPAIERPRESAVAEASPAVPVPAPDSPAIAAVAVGGRVVDLQGLPVAGVPLRWSRSDASEAPATTSRPDGGFELPLAHGRGLVVAAGPDFSTVFGAEIHPAGEQRSLLVVVAPRARIAGEVVDESSRPIPGAAVEIHCDRSVLAGVEAIVDQSSPIRRRVATDFEGRFEIPDAPATSGLMLRTSAPGYDDRHQPTPDRATDDLRIVLARTDRVVLRGEVLDPSGARVPGAWVACAGTVVASDAEGVFLLEPGTGDRVTTRKDLWPSAEVVVAVKAGHRPARFPQPAEGWPAFITLRLGDAPLQIRGRVVDPSGQGLPGVSVVARGEEILGGVAELPGSRADERSIESLLRGRGLDDLVKTDDSGKFAFGGLLDRSYDLAFFEKETLRIASVPGVAAGREDLLVVMSGAADLVPVRGRVESSDGKPVDGLRITAVRSVDSGTPGGEPWSIWGPTATSDAKGRFDLGRVPPDGLWFQAVASTIDPIFRWSPPPGMSLDDLRLTVSRRCHVQVDLGARGVAADSFQVLDEGGNALTLARWSGSLGMVGDSAPILGGRSEVVAVPETGRTVVLRIHGREVLRQPIRLRAGEIVSVRP